MIREIGGAKRLGQLAETNGTVALAAADLEFHEQIGVVNQIQREWNPEARKGGQSCPKQQHQCTCF
ncbi:hypothetical protein LR48_Vigan01g132900 [Vigna angularis]|uniref:Uncharacterized protein n=1 Tax=Phaseolus angularis TaxID=3914 RepID=A0A0L9TNM7_PHAAN|nr:hypothetical protein LR48_Vigan01g132900 [Vigna angularis]